MNFCSLDRPTSFVHRPRLLRRAAALLVIVGTATTTNAQVPTPRDVATAAPNEDVSENFDLERALVSSEHGLTAEEAGRRARARAPQLKSARASATSARWDAKAQWAAFLPQLQVYGQYKRINRIENRLFSPAAWDPAEIASDLAGVEDPEVRRLFGRLFEGFGGNLNFTQPVDSYTLGATARIPASELFLRVFPTYKASDRIAEARAIEVETRAATVDLTAREAFYAHARAVATQLVAARALEQAEAQAAQTKLFVDAGTVAPVDLMTATARRESMRSSLARTRGQVAITRNTLATLTGISREDASVIHEPVTTLPEAPQGELDELLARAFAARPELRAMRKLVSASEQQRRAERNGALPTLSLDGSALYAQPNPRYVPPLKEFRSSWEVGATVAWTPNNSVVGYQRAQRAASEVAKAEADLAALEDTVRIDLVQAYEDFHAASAAANAAEAQQQAAEESYRVRLATYRVGAGVQIDLLAADLAVTQARLDRANAVIDARIALSRLRRALGEPQGTGR